MNRYAKKELEKIHMFDGRGDFYGGLVGNCVMELLDILDEQGHSGYSYEITLDIFERLSHEIPLSPLTGEDLEWIKCPDGRFQNLRYKYVFKDDRNGKAYNTRAKIFTEDGGKTWHFNDGSKEYIKFPYTVPKHPREYYLNNLRSNVKY